MSLRSSLAIAIVCLAGFIAPSSLSACDWLGGGFGYYGWNYHRLPLRTGNVPSPPYFALHPPVYYSGLQYRPYGDSPFAYWPSRPIYRGGYMQAVAAEGPKMIENPYVEGASKEAAHRAKGRMIINPYYHSDGDQLAKTEQ